MASCVGPVGFVAVAYVVSFGDVSVGEARGFLVECVASFSAACVALAGVAESKRNSPPPA